MRTLLIDNNDSFTRNLEHLLAAELPAPPEVVPYAEFAPGLARECDLLVISPGPGHPREYPAYAPLFAEAAPDVPVLGVCLGLQIINEAFGGRTARLPGCVHGKADSFEFAGRPVTVARYHSLYLSEVAPELSVLAANRQGVPMAVGHAARRILGYQFHPESFLTGEGGLFIRHALDFFASR